MSQKIGHGTQFEIGNADGPPETFTPVAGVVSCDFGSDKVDTVDSTDMLTAGSTRTYIGGLENPGDVTVKLNVIPGDTSQLKIFTARDSAQHNFKVIYPGAVRTRAFAAIVTSIDESIPDDKLPTYSVKLQVTGPIVNS